MNKLKTLSGVLAAVALLLIVSILADNGTGRMNQAFAAEGGHWQNVTVLYLNDVKGKVEPCG